VTWISYLMRILSKCGIVKSTEPELKLTLFRMKIRKTGYRKPVPEGMKRYADIDWMRFKDLAGKLVGKPYKFGAEVNLKDPDPFHIKAIDCSEICEWLFAQIGLYLPDGSYNQIKYTVPVDPKNLLAGDLGFKWNPETEVVHHVGIYLGNDRLIEAKGKKWGVVIVSASDFQASSHFARWGRHKEVYVDGTT